MKKNKIRGLILLLYISLTTGMLYSQDAPVLERNIKPLQAGDALPAIELTDTEYHPVSLHSYLEDTPILLIYYRGGW